MAAIVMIGMIGAVAFAGVAVAETDEAHPSDITPGERLSGVIGVVDAEFEGDIRERSFGIAVAQAASDEAKADVVAHQIADVEDRVEALEERKAELKEQREAGEITEGKYQAEMAKLSAEIANVERLGNASGDVAAGLPAELLEERGINATAIQTLQDRAHELNGSEVSEIARSIAGENPGNPLGPDRDDVPPVDHPQNVTDDTPANESDTEDLQEEVGQDDDVTNESDSDDLSDGEDQDDDVTEDE